MVMLAMEWFGKAFWEQSSIPAPLRRPWQVWLQLLEDNEKQPLNRSPHHERSKLATPSEDFSHTTVMHNWLMKFLQSLCAHGFVQSAR